MPGVRADADSDTALGYSLTALLVRSTMMFLNSSLISLQTNSSAQPSFTLGAPARRSIFFPKSCTS